MRRTPQFPENGIEVCAAHLNSNFRDLRCAAHTSIVFSKIERCGAPLNSLSGTEISNEICMSNLNLHVDPAGILARSSGRFQLQLSAVADDLMAGPAPIAAPIGPAPSGSLRWKPISLQTSCVFSGGYQNKSYAMDCESVLVSNREQVFIKVTKTESWLLAACRGSGYRRGDLKRSSILELLTAKAIAAWGDDEKPSDDPMNDIECAPTSSDEPIKKKKRQSPIKRAADQVASVEVDLVPKAADPKSVATRQVRVLLKTAGKHSVLKVHAEDVPWLVGYIADEVACGGVVQAPGEDLASTVVDANSDVPGLHVEWDFQHNVWMGEFVSGPMKGQTCSCGPSKFTSVKWDKLVLANRISGSFAEATPGMVENACLKFLELHCEGVLANSQSVGENSQ